MRVVVKSQFQQHNLIFYMTTIYDRSLAFLPTIRSLGFLLMLWIVSGCVPERDSAASKRPLGAQAGPVSEENGTFCPAGRATWLEEDLNCSGYHPAFASGIGMVVVDHTGETTGSMVITCDKGVVTEWPGRCGKR
jgi:hypothetical protein